MLNELDIGVVGLLLVGHGQLLQPARDAREDRVEVVDRQGK